MIEFASLYCVYQSVAGNVTGFKCISNLKFYKQSDEEIVFINFAVPVY